MLDIIFLSYDEPEADKNFRALQDRFPHARRVHGVKGIANAHIVAAKKAMTKFFYVVDADAVIEPDFDFSFKPVGDEEKYVHIWRARQPIGIIYGYGGVKMFSKSFFKEVKSQVDFSTTLTKDVKYHEQISNTTKFNTDKLRSFRGAFRESAKLYSTAMNENLPEKIRNEAMYFLDQWMNPVKCDFRKCIVEGTNAGIKFAGERSDISFINEHELIAAELRKRYPEVEMDTNPIPKNEMKQEFFFTSRIASALYDPTVLASLPITELRDALSDGQLFSKNWLVQTYKDELVPKLLASSTPRLAILGGWLGTLALLMNAFELNASITSIDLDTRANRIAEKLNWDFDFKTMTKDMYEVDYSEFDVIINTSSEHIPDIRKWRAGIPKNKIIIVQNNNFEAGDGHVSCVQNSDQLREMMDFEEVLYEGTRTFPQYDRYMLIGRT